MLLQLTASVFFAASASGLECYSSIPEKPGDADEADSVVVDCDLANKQKREGMKALKVDVLDVCHVFADNSHKAISTHCGVLPKSVAEDAGSSSLACVRVPASLRDSEPRYLCWCAEDQCNGPEKVNRFTEELAKQTEDDIQLLTELLPKDGVQDIRDLSWLKKPQLCFTRRTSDKVEACLDDQTVCMAQFAPEGSPSLELSGRSCHFLHEDFIRRLDLQEDGGVKCLPERNGKVRCFCLSPLCNDAKKTLYAARHLDDRHPDDSTQEDSAEQDDVDEESREGPSEPNMILSTNRLQLSFSNVKEFVHISNAGNVPIAYKVESGDWNIMLLNHCGIIQPMQQASVCMWAPQCLGLSKATLVVKGVEAPGGVYHEALFHQTDRIITIETFQVCY